MTEKLTPKQERWLRYCNELGALTPPPAGDTVEVDEKALEAAIPVGSNFANAHLVRAIIAAYEAAKGGGEAVDLEKVEEALEGIARMAEVRAADAKQVFTRVNRGALRNIASRARSVLSDIRKARE